jgi:hypothetical protein
MEWNNAHRIMKDKGTHPVTLALALVAVDCACWPAVLAQDARDIVGAAFCSHEDENLATIHRL